MHETHRNRRDLLVVHFGVEPGLEEVDGLLEARVCRGVARLGAAGGGDHQQGEDGEDAPRMGRETADHGEPPATE